MTWQPYISKVRTEKVQHITKRTRCKDSVTIGRKVIVTTSLKLKPFNFFHNNSREFMAQFHYTEQD